MTDEILDEMDDEFSEEMFQVAKFGLEARNFFESDLGQYLVNKATSEAEAAVRAFRMADPTDAKEMMKTQNAINIPHKIIDWIRETIKEGEACENHSNE